ncbi:hypothetical protein BDP27DRAFT_1422670 [Rhodocollybia butyracea]|uniref:Uncharacterized protein n=1 Tax=Rhodocollybia butyracea TaxID=206335 RepID=A0A9P5PR38_9AGAR|nr:hypothetical protein BDP27DRAFT_1422670 [Rhodocollybia butyracea]
MPKSTEKRDAGSKGRQRPPRRRTKDTGPGPRKVPLSLTGLGTHLGGWKFDVRERGEPSGPSGGREGEIQLDIRPATPPASIPKTTSVVLPAETASISVETGYTAPQDLAPSSWTEEVQAANTNFSINPNVLDARRWTNDGSPAANNELYNLNISSYDGRYSESFDAALQVSNAGSGNPTRHSFVSPALSISHPPANSSPLGIQPREYSPQIQRSLQGTTGIDMPMHPWGAPPFAVDPTNAGRGLNRSNGSGYTASNDYSTYNGSLLYPSSAIIQQPSTLGGFGARIPQADYGFTGQNYQSNTMRQQYARDYPGNTQTRAQLNLYEAQSSQTIDREEWYGHQGLPLQHPMIPNALYRSRNAPPYQHDLYSSDFFEDTYQTGNSTFTASLADYNDTTFRTNF